MNEYKKVCNKLHSMWYAWNWWTKLITYKIFTFKTDWTMALYTYIGEKIVCHWPIRDEAISARTFLLWKLSYDL